MLVETTTDVAVTDPEGQQRLVRTPNASQTHRDLTESGKLRPIHGDYTHGRNSETAGGQEKNSPGNNQQTPIKKAD